MLKMKFIGSGMNPENWNLTKELYNQELIKVLNEAKREQKISLKQIGEVCDYSKSQVDNFFKGKTVMDKPTMKKMVDFLKVHDKVSWTALFERLQRSIVQMADPDLDAEGVERVMDSFWDDGQEYIEFEQKQERQLREMEQWFLGMDIRDCFLLDESYMLYEKAKIPDIAAGFIRNYAAMEASEREQFKSCMGLVTVPVGTLYNRLYLAERFRELACMDGEDVARNVKMDLVQEGREKTYTSQEFLQIRKVEHWESFRDKLRDSSYVTGDYFYEWMRFLPRMDRDMWEVLSLFLMIGDSSADGMTQWQSLFDSIVPDVV